MADRKRPKGFQIYGECYRLSQLHEKSETTRAGTLGALIKKYRASPAFQSDISDRTRSDYQKCFDYLKSIEDTPLTSFTPPLIVNIRNKAGESKGRKFGSYVRTVLSLLFAWSKERGEVKDNPAAGIKSHQATKERATGASAMNGC